jgi:hypothetical protein
VPAFARGQTHVTSAPAIQVDGLPPGTYRFRLVVEDGAGNLSAPADAVVVVEQAPTVTNPLSGIRSVLGGITFPTTTVTTQPAPTITRTIGDISIRRTP